MRIAIGCDHRGYRLKEILKAFLTRAGHTIQDLGCQGENSVDYPDFALSVARTIAARKAQFGILICSSGVGMSIAANKVRGIRAALCCNELMAARSRQHNDANVLCLGADYISPTKAKRVLGAWLASEFEGGRHRRRLRKIARQERDNCAQ